ncbi:MAG: winged helix-turn-helix domain-containing protein [Chloroflexota bacterium]|nr:winged helix-turn-helix domain-containing protein [Chloroflexota bacterium]
MLARHGWRKRVPRPTHPEADPAAQEAFKKTSRARS